MSDGPYSVPNSAEFEVMGPERPESRLIVDDAAPEALVDRMGAQGDRIALASPEAAILGMWRRRYSQDSVTGERSAFLSAYCGEPIVVDRMGREGGRIVSLVTWHSRL